MFHIQKGSASEGTDTCLLLVMTQVLTVGTLVVTVSVLCTMAHVTCSMHVTHAGYQYVELPNINVRTYCRRVNYPNDSCKCGILAC